MVRFDFAASLLVAMAPMRAKSETTPEDLSAVDDVNDYDPFVPHKIGSIRSPVFANNDNKSNMKMVLGSISTNHVQPSARDKRLKNKNNAGLRVDTRTTASSASGESAGINDENKKGFNPVVVDIGLLSPSYSSVETHANDRTDEPDNRQAVARGRRLNDNSNNHDANVIAADSVDRHLGDYSCSGGGLTIGPSVNLHSVIYSCEWFWQDCYHYYNCTAMSDWDTSRVTDMSYAFYSSWRNYDLSSWDTSSVTDMSYMFSWSRNFNNSLNSWNTSSVENMRGMFDAANKFNQEVDAWDTSAVTDMGLMFHKAVSFNQPVDAWDVSSVSDMTQMFGHAVAFNQPIDAWDVSSVSDMTRMFGGAVAFNQCISTWPATVHSLTSIEDTIFEASGCPYQDSEIGVSPWCQNALMCSRPFGLCRNNPEPFYNEKGNRQNCKDLASGKKDWDKACSKDMWMSNCPGLCDEELCPCTDFDRSFRNQRVTLTCEQVGSTEDDLFNKCRWCGVKDVCRGTCRRACSES